MTADDTSSREAKETAIAKWTLILQVFTLVIVVAGGICGYVFVGRYNVRESNANTELLNVTTQLQKMESELKGLKDRVDISQRRTQLSADVMQVLSDLVPKISVKPTNSTWNADTRTLTMELTIENSGQWTFDVGRPLLQFSRKPIGKGRPEELFPQEDYSVDANDKNTLWPGTTTPDVIVVVFNKPVEAPVYARVAYPASLRAIERETVRNILGDVVPVSNIEGMCSATGCYDYFPIFK